MNKFEEKMFDTLVDRDISSEILGYIKNLQKKAEQCKLLLSYIEQLENNRNKVIEYIKATKTTSCPDVTGLEKNSITEFWFVNELYNILKGGSDEI